MKKVILLSIGGAVGYVVGARAGRPAYDRLRDTMQALTRRTGLAGLATTAKEAAVDVREVATERATDAVAQRADELRQRIDDLGPRSGTDNGAEAQPGHPLPTRL